MTDDDRIKRGVRLIRGAVRDYLALLGTYPGGHYVRMALDMRAVVHELHRLQRENVELQKALLQAGVVADISGNGNHLRRGDK